MKIIVYHDLYGCETGCCGHRVEVDHGDRTEDKFFFDHNFGGDPLDFAKTLVKRAYGEEHVVDLDWDNCIIEE